LYVPRFSPAEIRIAALQGGTRAQVQATLAEFAALSRRRGLRVAGLIEITSDCSSDGCRSLALRDLTDGNLISISQDLGQGAEACNLDPGGLAAACFGVERAIAEGADLVVLSKFGKQEAARSGLRDAFHAAVCAALPIVTAVAPSLSDAWQAFAGPLSTFVAPEISALDAWWQATRAVPYVWASDTIET
jgi:hypothetical protein